MLGMNYGPDDDPLAILKERTHAAISVYAQGDDYHDLIKSRLKELARWLTANAGGDVKVFVDTAQSWKNRSPPAAGSGGRESTRTWCPGPMVVVVPRFDFHDARSSRRFSWNATTAATAAHVSISVLPRHFPLVPARSCVVVFHT